MCSDKTNSWRGGGLMPQATANLPAHGHRGVGLLARLLKPFPIHPDRPLTELLVALPRCSHVLGQVRSAQQVRSRAWRMPSGVELFDRIVLIYNPMNRRGAGGMSLGVRISMSLLLATMSRPR